MSILIVIMLGISFAIIYKAQKESLALKFKYPKINCKEFSKDYSGKRYVLKKKPFKNSCKTRIKIQHQGEQVLPDKGH